MAAPSADVFLPAAGAGARGGKKILGLPPWAIGLAAAGGLVVAYLIFKNRSSSSSTADTTGATDDSSGAPLDTSVGAGAGGSPLPTDPTAGAPDLSATNDLLGQILNMLQNPSNSGDASGIAGTTDVGGFGSGAPGSPAIWHYDPATQTWTSNPPNTFDLGWGSLYDVADVASPAYQASLASLTSYWQSLGSPTSVLAAQQAAGQTPELANSSTAIGSSLAAALAGAGARSPAPPPASAVPHPSVPQGANYSGVLPAAFSRAITPPARPTIGGL